MHTHTTTKMEEPLATIFEKISLEEDDGDKENSHDTDGRIPNQSIS
jgi:hypothetical protein